jgi:hypothetical protein
MSVLQLAIGLNMTQEWQQNITLKDYPLKK